MNARAAHETDMGRWNFFSASSTLLYLGLDRHNLDRHNFDVDCFLRRHDVVFRKPSVNLCSGVMTGDSNSHVFEPDKCDAYHGKQNERRYRGIECHPRQLLS